MNGEFMKLCVDIRIYQYMYVYTSILHVYPHEYIHIVSRQLHAVMQLVSEVLRARQSFIMAELGARWGTWGARAAAALAMLNPMLGWQKGLLAVHNARFHVGL